MNVISPPLVVIKRMVGGMVALLLGWMVLLGLIQLLLRWTAAIGLPWADLQLRQMVLWVGILGGVLAAADRRHIRIDLVEHYLSGRIKGAISKATNLISALGSFYLAYISIGFISSEREAELVLHKVLFGLSLCQWIAELVIPVGFALMGIYFLASLAPQTRLEPSGSPN